MSLPIVTVTDAPTPQARAIISDGLDAYNGVQAGHWDGRSLAVLVSDPETGAVLGGLTGRTGLGLLFIDLVYLPDRLRGQGLGTQILRQAEDEARRRGCRSGVLITITFQAPAFYARHGWQEFGRVPCDPPGTARVFFRKSFAMAGQTPTSGAPQADPVAAARRSYAEELRFVAHLRSPAVVEAFATVPRERFVGPGPWRVRSPMDRAEYWTTEDADPRHVYHDALIALVEARGLNNGQPSLWAGLFDHLGLSPGEHVLHLGCGTGYYSAVLAELVGPLGTVTAVEINARLAEQARAALAAWPQVTVIHADGAAYDPGPVETIVASAGATHPLPLWLDSLKPGGRLLFPLTAGERRGGMLLVTRRESDGFAARIIRPVWFIEFAGARDPEMSQRLEDAFARGDMGTVKSLRRDAHSEDASCWLHAQDWCLSRREPGASAQ